MPLIKTPSEQEISRILYNYIKYILYRSIVEFCNYSYAGYTMECPHLGEGVEWSSDLGKPVPKEQI